MTERTPSLIALRVRNGESSAQVALWIEEKTTTMWVRPTPDSATPKPRWMPGKIPATLWPQRSDSAKQGAIGIIQGYLSRKMSGDGPFTIEGIWVVEFSDKDHEELDSGTTQPDSLKTRLARVFDQSVPRSVLQDDLAMVADWIVDGPLIGLAEDDLDTFTTSVFSGPTKVAAISEEDLSDGILLTDEKTRFIPRPWWGGMTDVQFLRSAREAGIIVLLPGPPGTGKSAAFEAAFIDAYREAGMVFKEDALIVGTEDTTVQDIIGGMAQDADGIYRFKPGKLIRCMEEGVPLFMDEALLIDPRVLSVTYGTIDGRGILTLPEEYQYVSKDGTKNAVHAQPGFYIMFAGNPHVPGAVISEALASRCVLKPEYLTDYATVRRLLGKAHDEIVTVAENMETKRREGEVLWAPQMRDLLGYRDVAAVFGTEVALSNLIANCDSDSDREVFKDVIARVMGVSNVRPFTL